MLSLCDSDEVVRSIYKIARGHDEIQLIETAEQLREGYLAFLSARQPAIPVNASGDIFVGDLVAQEKLSAAFAKGVLNDLNQEDVVGGAYEKECLSVKTDLARRALDELLNMDEDLGFVFNLVVHSIFVRPSKPAEVVRGSHGGSSSASIGVIWLAVNNNVTHIDLVEMLVHELTHHLMFIDELNNPQFNYKLITLRENFALSAILKRQRPLDKVVHSIVVGASLVDARHRFLHNHGPTVIHPSTADLQRNTLAAVDSVLGLQNIDELITGHMRGLIDECAAVCRQPN